ncbi:hypothetical protein RND81_14G030800 [Saponaria officinalis]|uniref:Uncharacterized protein n=1 Tax=Saponaria officinalis TaxID=3572 RepID=A0AAW1GKU7_SAPOF
MATELLYPSDCLTNQRMSIVNTTHIRRGTLVKLSTLTRFKKVNYVNNDKNQNLVNDSWSRPVVGEYAGSAFVVSPSPESVPLPSFSTKAVPSVDCSATRDLRRLLGLEST